MQNDLSPIKDTIVFGLDSVVIRKCLADIQGGRTLDCSGLGVTKDILTAGHVIIKLADGNYAPMPLTPGVEGVAASPAEYSETTDSTKQDGKTYYTRSGSEGSYTYTEFTGTWVEGTTYYEQTKEAVVAVEAVPEAYAALPAGAAYAGILKSSILVKKPTAAILTAGVVNPECIPYPMDSILAAFKAALPTIIFEKDEEA